MNTRSTKLQTSKVAGEDLLRDRDQIRDYIWISHTFAKQYNALL